MDIHSVYRFLVLAVLVSFGPQIAANPTIEEEPDFYSMPGLNSQRSYDVTDNLVVDTFSGTLQTHSVDMVLQGTGPDIVVQRSYNSVPSVLSEHSYMGPGWDVHFGRIVGEYNCYQGTYTQNTLKLFYIKPDGAQVQIHDETVLFLDFNEDNGFDPETDYKPELTTADFWRVECRGNQLVLTDTQGTNYYMGASDSPDTYARYVVVQVEDTYNQTIEIDYEWANVFSRPTLVSSSDGREVTFSYENFRLSSITDGEISVNYIYENNHLERVEFPESLVWEYGYQDNSRLLSEVTTPLGAIISIDWENYFIQNKDYPVVGSKCIEDDCWIYAYNREYDDGETLQDITTITTPYATREVYYHITPLNVSDGEIWRIGLLTKKDIYREPTGSVDPSDIDPCSAEGGFANDDSPISTTTYGWDSTLYSMEDRVYLNTGVSLIDQEYRKPALQYSEETRNNETYIYEVLSRYADGLPAIIKETGNITRYIQNHYYSDGESQGNWFVGLPALTTISEDNVNYDFVSSTDYNDYGRVERMIEQGAETVFHYDDDGNLHSVTDGEDNTTYYTNYHRRIPRRVDYPDLTYVTRFVDDRGRIQSETNQKFITTRYDYDDLDRITFIDLPLTNDVDIFYSTDGEYKRFTKGNLRETYRYNELGNMVRHTREDLAGGKQFVRNFDYDVRNQLIFESMVNDTDGTFYKYSLLGELVKVRTTNGEVVVHNYDNFQQTTTNAKCYQTVRSFEATSVSSRHLITIDGPENLYIDIERNVLGQPLDITQDGIVRSYRYYDGTWLLKTYKDPEADAIYTYGYNDAGRLTVMTAGPVDTPNNTYSVIYDYDELGRLETQIYSTLYVVNAHEWDIYPPESCGSLNTGMSCYYNSTQDTYLLDYDDVGNLESKVRTTTRSNWGLLNPYPTSYTESTSWTYSHDDENRLESEELISYSGDVFRLTYSYDDIYGYLASVTYPPGNQVSYAPDVFGRPTQAGSIVSDVAYYDTGAIRQLTYGNGMVVDYTLNDRKLTKTMKANLLGGSLVDLEYGYDLNRNLELIQDYRDPGKNRDMGYDGLDRMTSANGQWGSGVYRYDELSNFEFKTVGGQTDSYLYHPTSNRLTQFNGRTIEYDIYGRITHDGNNRYFYDFSNNLTKATNLITDEEVRYRYDANNRMESSGQNFGESYLYNAAGKLMYEVQRSGDLKRSHIYLGFRLVGYHDMRIECSDDSDDDGMPHCYERENGLNVSSNDAGGDKDGDNISNFEEYELGLLAGNADSDGDGIEDDYELEYNLDPLSRDDRDLDPDQDGFTNYEEFLQGSDPNTETILTPAAQFSAEFAEESVIVTWLPVINAEGYDLYWSNTPFDDLSSVNIIENVSSPYLHNPSDGEVTHYYRLVTKKNEVRSTPTALKVAESVDKAWSFVTTFDEYVDELGVDDAGNVFAIHPVGSSSSVSYWDASSKTISNYHPFPHSFHPRLSVASNGYAMFSALEGNGQLWAAVFNPVTKTWTSEFLGSVSGAASNLRDFRIVASGHGAFAITWVGYHYNTRRFRAAKSWSIEAGWGPTVRAYYQQEESPYYEHYASDYAGLEVTDNGDMALAWTLVNPSTTETSSHLIIFPAGGDPYYKILSDNASGAEVSLNNGEGIVAWYDKVEEVSYSQRFNVALEFDEPESLGISGGRVIAIHLEESQATAFITNSDDRASVSINDSLTGWSAPIDSTLSAYSRLYETRSVPGGGVYAYNYSTRGFLFKDGEINSLDSEPTNLISFFTSSDITSAGNLAMVGSEVQQGYPVFIYKSQSLPENQLPVADAGPDLHVVNQDIMTLNASASTDDGIILRYTWRLLPSGWPSSSTFATRESSISSVTEATYEYELTVTDDRGGQSTDTVVITVNNNFGPPTADAGEDRTVMARSGLIQLSAENSVDGLGNPIVGYLWEQIAGPQRSIYSPDSETTSISIPFIVDEPTELVFQLTVSTAEDHYFTDTDTVTITVLPNEYPVVDLGPDQIVVEGSRVVIDYSEAYDPDGGTVSGEVSIATADSGITIEPGAVGTVEFDTPDVEVESSYQIRVTLTDDEGSVRSYYTYLTVLPKLPGVPMAVTGANIGVLSDQLVVLNGSESIAPDGFSLISYQWTQISGPLVTLNDVSSPVPQFTAPWVTKYTILEFELEVTSSDGQTATDNVRINVSANPDLYPPFVDAGPTQYVAEGSTVTLTAEASTEYPENPITSYSWVQTTGPVVELSGDSSITPSFVTPSVDADTWLSFELTITTGSEYPYIATDRVFIMVTNEDPPVADFGPDQEVSGNDLVVLDYSASLDPDGGEVTGVVSLVAGEGINPSPGIAPQTVEFMAPEVGVDTVYTFRVIVTDDEGSTAYDDVSVLVFATPDSSAPIEVNLSTTSPYTSHDSNDGSVQASDDSLTLIGNRWRYVDGAVYTLTPDTVIEFDFSSDGLGEIQGIAFDNDHLVDNGGIVFKLIGSQNWGNQTYSYTGNGAVQSFSIPVGQYLTGDNWQLLIINDNDAAPNSSTVTVSNVRLCEVTCDPNPDPDPNYLDLSANSAYTSNDSNSGSVQASGNSLTLTGNRWRFIDDAVVTLTSNTIIEFEFSSDGLGEIQGIAFDNDHTIDNGGVVFKLVGSQNWGNQTYSYTGNGAVQSFSIPVGQYLTGDNWQLLIINDNDAAPNSSTVTINNVRLCEVTCDPDPEPDPNYLDLSANSAYTSNDSNNGSVQASGNSLTLTGNRWRFIDDAVVTLTSNSIIEFEFSSDGLGEIQGLAFDNDHTIDNGGIVFRLIGSQDWGNPNYPYTGNGAVQSFSIPVGQFLTGDNWQLLIINDNDAAPNSSTLTIDKVRICETSCGGAAQ